MAIYGRGEDRFIGLRPKTQNQLEELREENKRLREIVADLSELVLTQIAEQSNRVVPKPNKGRFDDSAQRSASNECVRLIRKLRWIGMDDEAERVLRRKVGGRVRLTNGDRLFLIQLYRWFSRTIRDGDQRLSC